MFNEANRDQVIEMQSENYAKRIGQVYGDFTVVDVWYDWESHKQMWRMVCCKCGRERVTSNGADYRKGKNKGICGCEAEKLRLEKIAAKQKRLDDAPNNPKWFGMVFDGWKVLGYEPGLGWCVECTDCGRITHHSVSAIRESRAPKCLCKFNYGKYSDKEWVGKRYGHLTITEYRDTYFYCLCDCGRTVKVKPSFLINGKQITCGKSNCEYHKPSNYQHGLSNERLYRIWNGMNNICSNPQNQGYKYYGGRGITVCKEWKNDFLSFRKWALSHGYSDNLSIDRIDCDGNYCPENCRWATAKEQANNQHPKYTFTPKPDKIERKRKLLWTIGDETKSAIEWCEQYGVSVPFARYRVDKLGMSPYEALTTPKVRQGRPKKSAS